MKVVFLEEVEGTARAGDVKNVADGFARNYLLPRKLAAPATQHYIAIAEQKATKDAKRQDREDAEARERILPLVEGHSITIEVRVGEQDKLFGSVTSRDIAEKLQEETKVELEHRQVDLKQPLREIGSHQVAIKITRNVIANVTVNVEPIGGMPVVEEAEEVEAEAEATAEATAEAAEGPVDEEPSPAETADVAETPEDAAETADVDTAAEVDTTTEEAAEAPDEERSSESS